MKSVNYWLVGIRSSADVLALDTIICTSYVLPETDTWEMKHSWTWYSTQYMFTKYLIQLENLCWGMILRVLTSKLLILLCVLSCSVMSESLSPCGLYLARLLCPWGLSRQEHWSGLPYLPSGVFLTQGSNPGLPHCRRILYHLSHQITPLQYSCLENPMDGGAW